MRNFILILQIILSIILTTFVLLQASGSGFGATWQGGGETYHTRRGLEKIVFYLTIIGVIGFIILSIMALAL